MNFQMPPMPELPYTMLTPSDTKLLMHAYGNAVLEAVAADLETQAKGWSAALEANIACAIRWYADELRAAAKEDRNV